MAVYDVTDELWYYFSSTSPMSMCFYCNIIVHHYTAR